MSFNRCKGVAIIKIPGTNATTGKEISFMVGDLVADEVDTWETGGHLDKSFQISLTTYVPPPPAVPDHQSRLVVTINGEMAPDDTNVTAIMDGEEVAMAMTKDGIAFLKVPGTSANGGKEIRFRVGDVMADEVDTWEQGGHRDKKFEISLTTYVPPPPLPPHISRLLVSIDGLPAPDGTVVTAWMDGAVAVATAVTANGVAIIRIEGDGSDGGGAISFTIGVLTGGVPGGLMETWPPPRLTSGSRAATSTRTSPFRSTPHPGRRPSFCAFDRPPG